MLFYTYLTTLDVLVSTLRLAHRLPDLTKEEIEDLFQTVVKIQKVVEQEYNANSSTVTVQDGPFAGQTVPVGKKIVL